MCLTIRKKAKEINSEKRVLYFDNSAFDNLINVGHINVGQIKSNYTVYISLINYFEIVVYKRNSIKQNLLNYLGGFNEHLPLDLPTRIIRKYLIDIKGKGDRTCWSIQGDDYPDWKDDGNINVISEFLKKEKAHFEVTNAEARKYVGKDKLKSKIPIINNSKLYLDYIYSQPKMLSEIFSGISGIIPLQFPYQDQIELMKSLPLVCYFAPWLLAHHKLSFQRSHFSPKRNPNAIDVAHGFYMGACDVFVTDDERLHSLLLEISKFKYFACYKKVQVMSSSQFANSMKSGAF